MANRKTTPKRSREENKMTTREYWMSASWNWSLYIVHGVFYFNFVSIFDVDFIAALLFLFFFVNSSAGSLTSHFFFIHFFIASLSFLSNSLYLLLVAPLLWLILVHCVGLDKNWHGISVHMDRVLNSIQCTFATYTHRHKTKPFAGDWYKTNGIFTRNSYVWRWYKRDFCLTATTNVKGIQT